MAGADAVRSAGSLLVRALIVGGLTTAAWLLGSAIASAAPADHTDVVASAHDVVKTNPAALHRHRDEAPDQPAPVVESWASTVTNTVPANTMAANMVHTLMEMPHQSAAAQAHHPSFLPATHEADDAEESDEGVEPPGDDYSSATQSGAVSNSMPEPMVAAKLEAKAAEKLAAASASAPPAPEAESAAEPVTSTIVPQWVYYAPSTSTPVAVGDVDIESYTELDWELPVPSAPSPNPQPVSAPAAPTVSSGSHDNSGSTRWVLAVTTAQSSPHPATTWSVERRDDGRTPGSEQGLPSTSPD